MASKITPSPALITREDTPLSECINLMNDNRAGSILVISAHGQADLVGIFTERDLLVKFSEIREKQLWEGPIRQVMTAPVKTLDASQLDQAAQFMLKHHFRHVPVTLTDAAQKRTILTGVISMRDVFKAFANESGGGASWLTRASRGDSGRDLAQRKVSIFSKDQNFSSFLKKMFTDFALGAVTLIEFAKASTLTADILILDLDGLEVAIWTQYLKKLNQDPTVKAAVVVFDPALQSAGVGEILEKIGQSGKFSIFRKPIDILTFFERLSNLGFDTAPPSDA